MTLKLYFVPVKQHVCSSTSSNVCLAMPKNDMSMLGFTFRQEIIHKTEEQGARVEKCKQCMHELDSVYAICDVDI